MNPWWWSPLEMMSFLHSLLVGHWDLTRNAIFQTRYRFQVIVIFEKAVPFLMKSQKSGLEKRPSNYCWKFSIKVVSSLSVTVNLLSLHAPNCHNVYQNFIKIELLDKSILSAVCVQVEMELMGTQSHLFKGRRKKWSWCSFPAVQWRWWKVRRHQMGWYTFIFRNEINHHHSYTREHIAVLRKRTRLRISLFSLCAIMQSILFLIKLHCCVWSL